MGRERADREIEPLQAQRRQPDQHAETPPTSGRGKQRHHDRRLDMGDQCRRGESAGSDEAGMAERNLAGRAHQQVERQRADDRDEDLVGDAGPEIGQQQAAAAARRASPATAQNRTKPESSNRMSLR